MTRLSVVIPALDEAGALPGVIAAVREAGEALEGGWELILVDDGSRDATPAVMEAARAEFPDRVTVIRHETPRGCHPSTLDGFARARGDWVLFLPADGQIPPAVAGPMLAEAESRGLDAVVGVRARRADPAHRRWISRCYALLLRALLGLDCRDADSATLYRRDRLQAVLPSVASSSACIAAEILWRLTQSGGRFGEVPIPHLPRTTGRAKGVNRADALGVPRHLLALAWRRWIG